MTLDLTLDMVLDVVGAALLLAGVALTVVAAVGLVRFPDVFTRMHAATKPATLGLLLVCAGAGLVVDDGGDRAKLLLVAAFQFVTAPVAAHMVGRAAYGAGVGAIGELTVDELRTSDGEHPGS